MLCWSDDLAVCVVKSGLALSCIGLEHGLCRCHQHVWSSILFDAMVMCVIAHNSCTLARYNVLSTTYFAIEIVGEFGGQGGIRTHGTHC